MNGNASEVSAGAVPPSPDAPSLAGRRIGLAAAGFDEKGGGVARVAELLRAALEELTGRPTPLSAYGEGGGRGFAARLPLVARATAWQGLRRVDGVFFNHLHLARLQVCLPGFLRRPYAVFLHGIEVWRPLPAWARQAAGGAALRLANSRFTADRTATANPGFPPVEICPLALPPTVAARFGVPGKGTDGDGAATADDTRKEKNERIVLIVGRMSAAEKYKGHDELLTAWPEVVRAVPEARLHLVGEGDDLERLRRRAAALDKAAARTIHFKGFVAEEGLPRLYDEAQVFCLPSRGEGFGLAYLEAMARRRPCLGSVHDAAAEVIEDNVTGKLVSLAKPGELIATLVALLRDEALCRKMGAAGRTLLERKFVFEQFCRRLAELLTPVFK